jgi:hypothetical protein
LSYTKFDPLLFHNSSLPKISTIFEKSILAKLKINKSISYYLNGEGNYNGYHTRKLRYFVQFLDCAPEIYEEDGTLRVTSELKPIKFRNSYEKYAGLAGYLSNLFFWYYIGYSDCRNVNKREVFTFPFSLGELDDSIISILSKFGEQIIIDLQANSFFQTSNYQKYGVLKMQTFQPRKSKPIIDQIDTVLAQHYGFTEGELDFIVNYDIKYRMGKALFGEVEDLEEEED